MPGSMADAFSLAGKTALVTGGAAGIGEAITMGLAAAGADVALLYHSRPAEPVLAAVRGLGRRTHAVQGDLERLDEAAAAGIVAEVEAALGPVDILVNNAGIIHRDPALDHALKDWRRVMAVDLDAAFLVAQAVARRMAEHRKGGRIVNIASVLSEQGGVFVPGYAAAKHALLGLTRALANEWAALGINVNAIAPGYTATANTAALRADPERSAALLARIPAGRFAEPDEMAGAAVFLASPAASYVHGAMLAVDGGWLAR